MPKQVAQWIMIVPAFLLVTTSSPVAVLAEGGRIRASTELNYIATEADIRDKVTGEELETSRSSFLQLYNLELQKEIYPYLIFRTGGVFKLTDTTTTLVSSEEEGKDRSDFEERLGRVFAELNLNNPLYTAGVGYHWTQLKESNAVTEKLFREEYEGRLRWRPEGFPSVDLEFDRFRFYDDPETTDRVDDRLTLESRYNYKNLQSDYTYTRLDSRERILDSGFLTQLHDGGARYSQSFFGNRLSATGAFRLRYTQIDPSGEEDLKRPTDLPVGQFSVPDDSAPGSNDPEDYRPLDDDEALIGTTFPGDVGRSVSFGLDFVIETEIDTIYVLPDEDARELDSLVWEVWLSDDRETWELLDEAVYDFSYDYNTGYNRFEISFPPIDPSSEPLSTRHIKVRTSSQLTEEGEIGVAQLEALTTIPGGEGFREFVQNYNVGLRWGITDRTTAAYDGFYRREEDQPFDRLRTTLTNSIRLQHIFGPVFTASARALRTDGTSSERGDLVSHLYSASLRANYLDTLNQQLVYSGRHEKEELGSAMTNSILLRTNADLYRDWSMNLDLGYTWTKPIEGVKGTSALLRLGTDVAPNEKLRLVMNYIARWRTEEGESTELDQNAGFQAFWVPFRALSFFGRVNLRHREAEDEGLTVAQNYTVNWAPFPDGSLNFSFAYNEALDTRERESRIFSPQVEWQITRNALLTVRFNMGTIEDQRRESDVRNLRVELEIFY